MPQKMSQKESPVSALRRRLEAATGANGLNADLLVQYEFAEELLLCFRAAERAVAEAAGLFASPNYGKNTAGMRAWRDKCLQELLAAKRGLEC